MLIQESSGRVLRILKHANLEKESRFLLKDYLLVLFYVLQIWINSVIFIPSDFYLSVLTWENFDILLFYFDLSDSIKPQLLKL